MQPVATTGINGPFEPVLEVFLLVVCVADLDPNVIDLV